MKGAALLLVASLLLATACGGAPSVSGHGAPTPSPTADPVAAAWHRCGASQVPTKDILNAELPATTEIQRQSDVSESDAQSAATAFGHTNAWVNWAVGQNQLGFLQGQCVAAPLSRTEDGDIKVTKAAIAAGGYASFEPAAVPVRIGVRGVPAALADSVQSRISTRPAYALVLLFHGTTVWISDPQGHHIKKFGESDKNGLYASITLGSVRNDSIGSRLWQQAVYPCTDPEVVGLCDAFM